MRTSTPHRLKTPLVIALASALSSLSFAGDDSAMFALSAPQLDAVTAGIVNLESDPVVASTAAAEAVGNMSIAGTNTVAAVAAGNPTPAVFGSGFNAVTILGARAHATGDSSRSTSISVSENGEDGSGLSPFGARIFWSVGFGNTQLSVYSSVQPFGILASNLYQALNR